MGFSATATSAAVLYFLAFISVFSRSSHVTALAGSDVVVNATPVVLVESVPSKDVVRCARVTVSGLSRLKLGSYSSAHRITLVPSDEIQEKSYKNVQICLHRSVKNDCFSISSTKAALFVDTSNPIENIFRSNSSLGLCQCHNDNWESIQTEFGALVKLEFHKWRLLCLAIGFVLLLLAPIVSSWVPFYYSSSMAIGVCLVVIILLFQGMKLLPTGRKNALYSTLCGLAVLVFLLVGIVLAGAGFGYWLVRKFVVAEDGSVDVGVAQFVKWALRVIAVTFIFQSTLDTPLAMALLVFLLGIYFSLTSSMLHGLGDITYSGGGYSPRWRSSVRVNKNKRTEFLSRSGTTTPRRSLWKSPKSSPAWSNSPAKGVVTPSSLRRTSNPQDYNSTPSSLSGSTNRQDYYSTFHRTPNRKKFSKEEWKDFTEESTRQALAEWASSPEFTDWIVKHADRIQLQPEVSSDESIGSGSDSTDENIAQSSSGRGLLWQRRH
ncbi:hypothetical protein DH2020_014058 [Rehmannia glutinosa]|uniref:Transmembrane protein n=1 Tax=Rehmannia glutinosa TaxID=99300 RepID=A0ABR0WVA1_REHGL